MRRNQRILELMLFCHRRNTRRPFVDKGKTRYCGEQQEKGNNTLHGCHVVAMVIKSFETECNLTL